MYTSTIRGRSTFVLIIYDAFELKADLILHEIRSQTCINQKY
jgi:hypothetical protein